jgi:hypothetical protein
MLNPLPKPTSRGSFSERLVCFIGVAFDDEEGVLKTLPCRARVAQILRFGMKKTTRIGGKRALDRLSVAVAIPMKSIGTDRQPLHSRQVTIGFQSDLSGFYHHDETCPPAYPGEFIVFV